MAEEQERIDIEWITRQVNDGSVGRLIGELQKRRTERLNLTMVPSLFDGRTIKAEEGYAFHVGGLAELQFNIGRDDTNDEVKFRHGVAFSLQPTHSQPDIRVLVPKIERFNEFMQTYPDRFGDLRMWHHTQSGRSENYPPGAIPEHIVRPHVFIMLGTLQSATNINIEWILNDFDRLLPLYEYVEGSEAFPRLTRRRKGFAWSPGNKARAARTKYLREERTVDKALRHNILQDALFRNLEDLHGKTSVSGEQDCGNGTPVDVAVRKGKSFVYYEIKTGLSVQSCIRQALGQLMEYAYWPGAREADKLVVVGEPPLDAEAKKYLSDIRRRFGLPLYYQCFDPDKGTLTE